MPLRRKPNNISFIGLRFNWFYAPEIEDRGHIVLSCLSFCHSLSRPPLWNFNLANNFWTVSARALIVHLSIPCDKTFPWYHYFLINIRAFILHMSISCDNLSTGIKIFVLMWPWPSLELAIIGGICVPQTHLVCHWHFISLYACILINDIVHILVNQLILIKLRVQSVNRTIWHNIIMLLT